MWRVVARVDDEIIVKQSDIVEKAIRSARNAVCQRLCKSAGINYELGWWKGRKHKDRRDFVDNFLGTPLYLLKDEKVEVEHHDVPYEVYTIEIVRLKFRKMTLLSPENIDAWGNLHWGQGDDEKFNLLGAKLPIPPHLCLGEDFEEEEVIAICDAQTCLDECPGCKSDVPFGTIILITEHFRLTPTQCCSQMIWTREKPSLDNEDWS